MYIWRKRPGAGWLRLRNDELTLRFGDTLAVIERPGAKRVTLEIFARESEARELCREYGGSVERLRPDWLQHFTKQAHAKPLRIGSRLVILSRGRKKTGTAAEISRPSSFPPKRPLAQVSTPRPRCACVSRTHHSPVSAGLAHARRRDRQRHSRHGREVVSGPGGFSQSRTIPSPARRRSGMRASTASGTSNSRPPMSSNRGSGKVRNHHR